MDIKSILSKVDHTYLKQNATWDDIRRTCDEGIEYGVASVCIPPYFVKMARNYVGDKIKICTKNALENGADEIDMVINICDLKDKKYDLILNEISVLKQACGNKVLKVIIETCLLSDDEKIKMCELVGLAGADFIKTSTGFSSGGATFDDVALFKTHIAKGVQIKAAGGISSLDDAKKFIELGATRLGTSRIVKILQGGKENGNSSY